MAVWFLKAAVAVDDAAVAPVARHANAPPQQRDRHGRFSIIFFSARQERILQTSGGVTPQQSDLNKFKTDQMYTWNNVYICCHCCGMFVNGNSEGDDAQETANFI